ncbi:acyl-CoA dehydrogenase family protein [Kutzneria buriramensis]|uniref:Acyl-CoA dehydrogenase-like protein n=1 Tax=Kutzneria buriramensis TaxID=1045776 RepID=A0A3E0H215_9PSEU|nr:acyl-CoA dehydrogenase family protein [Kutzneria buriramensis]REH36323.1 acyl-CoA dehydrogenase-like protein [Kutzneria buriramensis]
MKFTLSEEQRDFAQALRDALKRSASWETLLALGVHEVESAPDLVVAFLELGRAAVPGPIVESFAVLREPRSTLAWPPHVPYVVDNADQVYAIVDDTKHRASIVEERTSVDPSRRLFTYDIGETVGPIDAEAFERGVLACSAQLVGLGRALIDRSRDYALQRSQFGKPIGSFQAVKHQLADAHVALELAEPLVFGAAVTMSRQDVSAARIAAGKAAYQAMRTALQVHGAIGYTAEFELSRWLLKVRALVTAWGTESWHRERLMATLCG